MKKIGLIINPIAGMGGKIGLKGTDDYSYNDLIKKFNASEVSKNKCEEALNEIVDLKNEIEFFTYGNEMGENLLKKLGFKYSVLGFSEKQFSTGKDTIDAAKKLLKKDVDLLIFVGGDGTARDIYEGVGLEQVCIGIPSGVKMQSAVHGTTPSRAGQLARKYLLSKNAKIVEREVMDIDEEKYRNGKIFSRLYGYLKIPIDKRFLQDKKTGSCESENYFQDSIATYIIDNMTEEFQYLIGPGSTTGQIMKRLNLKNSILGIDLIYNGKVLKNDMNEELIAEKLKERKTKLILTPTGGQGFLLGRGNQQLSSKIILELGRENIIIIATKTKLISLGPSPLLVDLNEEANKLLRGYHKIINGYGEYTMKKIDF